MDDSLLSGAVMNSPPSPLDDQEGDAPPVEQIEIKGEGGIDADSVLGVSSVFDMSYKSVDTNILVDHVAAKKEWEEWKEDDGDSNVSAKISNAVLDGCVESDFFGRSRKKRRTGGVKKVIDKPIREEFGSVLESIKLLGEEPSVDHPAIQKIMNDHELNDAQTNNQIN